MAYGSIKRVLGGSTLEQKCLGLLGACLLVLILGSFWWYGNQTDELVYSSNRRAGKLIVGTVLTGIHLEQLETSPDFKPTAKLLVEQLKAQDYTWRTISSHPEREPRDDFEAMLLDRWKLAGFQAEQQTPSIEELQMLFAERHLPEANVYQYYQPVYAERDCVLCHRSFGDFDLVEGDLVAVVQVSLSDEETVAAQNQNRAILLATAIITVFLAMIALYVIVRYIIVKPLRHLCQVSDEITRGNIEQRADIHTGDEFEELGEAFNRMLRHLSGAQNELRDLNTSLDQKVDELAHLNMQLYEMNRLKSDFLATVSHELRTPLNSIIGFSDVLDSIESLDDKQKRYVQNIKRSGRMLLEMINDILDLAKIESGKMELRLTEFNIDQVIAAHCDMARPLLEKKNIDLLHQTQPDLPPLYQDQSKVQQILSNLLSNAIKFTPEGGRITIAARRNERDQLELVVDDTGVGIAQEDQVAVFEKFRQGSSAAPSGDAMTREYSGTGLGLSIVKELCKLLGGEISLKSELGKGSTFTVYLPWSCEEYERMESPIAEELQEMTKPRRTEFAKRNEGDSSTLSAGPVK